MMLAVTVAMLSGLCGLLRDDDGREKFGERRLEERRGEQSFGFYSFWQEAPRW
jgi:hypothetical protein